MLPKDEQTEDESVPFAIERKRKKQERKNGEARKKGRKKDNKQPTENKQTEKHTIMSIPQTALIA